MNHTKDIWILLIELGLSTSCSSEGKHNFDGVNPVCSEHSGAQRSNDWPERCSRVAVAIPLRRADRREGKIVAANRGYYSVMTSWSSAGFSRTLECYCAISTSFKHQCAIFTGAPRSKPIISKCRKATSMCNLHSFTTTKVWTSLVHYLPPPVFSPCTRWVWRR